MKTVNKTAEVLSAGDNEDSITWFRASTNDIDRHGTIIDPLGIKTDHYDANPVFVWGHDAYGGSSTPALENVLGRVVEYTKSETSFDIGVRWATEEQNPKAQMAKSMVRGGILNAVSIGFIPNAERMVTKDVNGEDIPVYEETELVEVSLVTVPANPNATALIRSMQGDTMPPDKKADSGSVSNLRELAHWATKLRLSLGRMEK
jgi:HK97 family phage prohead protease